MHSCFHIATRELCGKVKVTVHMMMSSMPQVWYYPECSCKFESNCGIGSVSKLSLLRCQNDCSVIN